MKTRGERNEIATRKRKLTICRKAFPRQCNVYASFPDIRLSGKWLLDYGFKSGQVIDVVCESAGEMRISVAKEQRFEGL